MVILRSDMREIKEIFLKPCPFCGGEAKLMLKFVPFGDDEANQYLVGCPECDIWFSQLWESNRIIEIWNERKG